jgi:hypothetical protein
VAGDHAQDVAEDDGPTWIRAMTEVEISTRFIFQSAVPNRSQPRSKGSAPRM